MEATDSGTKIIDKEFMDAFMDKHMEYIKRKSNAVSTGYSDLDDMWGGLELGETYFIGGDHGMGKTSFALNMILEMHEKVALFSPAESKERLINRMLAIDTCSSAYNYPGKKLEDSELETIMESASKIANKKLIINDTPKIDIDVLDSELSTDIMAGVKIVFIDYLQCLTTEQIKTNDSDEQKICYISEKIQQMARKYNVAIVVLSRLCGNIDYRREDNRPVISKDMPYAAGIKRYFDHISFIYRDEYYNRDTATKGIAEIITEKNAFGKPGAVWLAYIPQYNLFKSLIRDD